MNFLFPRAKFVNENGIAKQVTHMNSEQKEIEESVNTPNIFHTAVEVMDKLHSCETGLRILAEKYGIDLDDVRDHVEAKNRARGYYLSPMKEAIYNHASHSYECPKCSCGCVSGEEQQGVLRCTGCQEKYLPADRLGMKTIGGKDIISMPDGGNLPADEGWFMPTENPFIHGCCDCGLVHRVEFGAIDKDGEGEDYYKKQFASGELSLILRFTRDEAETANLRKQKIK